VLPAPDYNHPVRVTATAALAAVVVAAITAGCGSSNKPSGGGGPAAADGLKFASCMRAHGLPSFPDPAARGGGIQIPNSVNPAAPAFQHALKACRRFTPGGPGGRRASGQQKEAMLQLSQCMRAHGVSGFPDPTSSPPGNPSGFQLAFGLPGAFIAIPNTIDLNAPVFKKAAATCHLPGA
jgi:hypothetical protein